MKLENITFKFNEKEINIKIDPTAKTAWFSLWDLATFFGKDRTVILRATNTITKNVNQNAQVVHKFAQVGQNSGTYMVTHYGLEVVLLLCQKYEPEMVKPLQEFLEQSLQLYEPIPIPESDVIIFDNGKLKISVSLSVKEETVYLSQNDIAVLYGTTRENVNLHINNIIQEGELDINSVSKYYLHTASDGKNYNVNKYNLDMILAVGYRTRTKDAISFRRWATEIIKSYLIKGYAVNNERCLECKDAIINLTNRVASLENSKYKEITYEPGTQLRGFIEIKRFLESAEKEILIVDNYFGHEFDEVLTNINVKKTVITNPLNTKIDTNDNYKVIKTDYFHDRYIFVDDICYHFGISPKDVGLHHSVAMRLQDFTINDVFKKLEKYENGRNAHK